MTYKEFFEQFPSLRVDDFRTALLGKSPLTQEFMMHNLLDKQRVREAIDEHFGCHCVDEEVECWGCRVKKELDV